MSQEKLGNGVTSHYGTKPGHFETSKIHFPTSEGVSEVSGASERASGRASDPVLTSRFLVDPDHSAAAAADATEDQSTKNGAKADGGSSCRKILTQSNYLGF